VNLTLFDLDHTLLAADSDHMWGQFLVDKAIVDADWYARENNRFYEQYQAGTMDVHAYQRFALQPLVDNPPEQLLALREEFIEHWIRPAVARQAQALIASRRAAGDCMAIITATNRFVTEPIAALLHIDHLIATEPEVIDGRHTGELSGPACFQAGKIDCLAVWRRRQPQVFERTRFYSDSHNDLPLLRHVDTAIAVDPDARLAAVAAAEGWPVISLRGAEVLV